MPSNRRGKQTIQGDAHADQSRQAECRPPRSDARQQVLVEGNYWHKQEDRERRSGASLCDRINEMKPPRPAHTPYVVNSGEYERGED